MGIRGKKLVGVFATVGFMVIYSLVAMALGAQYVAGQGKILELAYFVVAGLGWVPVAMAIIKWMSSSGPNV